MPYVRGWYDAFADPTKREVSLVSAAQTGKTQCFLNMVAFAVATDPGPLFYVLPASTLARSFSETRLQPMLRDCPATAAKIPENSDHFKLDQMSMLDMNINLAGANSAGQLASRPIRYLFLDEVDKFPESSAKEAGAVELAKIRTETFWNSKVMITSTPTVEDGAIWQSFLKGDQQYFHCPCPRCGESFDFEMDHIKWPKEFKVDGVWDLSGVERNAYMQCPHCEGRIEQTEKAQMVREGEWIASNPDAPDDLASFHLSSLYSPWRTWGSIAREMLAAKGNYSKAQMFHTNVLAKPWLQEAQELTTESLADLKKEYLLGEIPEGVKLITMGADVGQEYIATTVRGLGNDGESWLLDVQWLKDFDELRELTKLWKPTMGLIDAGFRSPEVYDFCSMSGGIWLPTKGSSSPVPGLVKKSKITYQAGGTYRQRHINLYHFDPNSYKSELALMRMKKKGAGWHLPINVSEDYCRQVTAERLVKKTTNGKEKLIWEQSRSRPNHYFDTEVLQLIAAHLLAPKLPKTRPMNQPDPVKTESKVVSSRARARSKAKKWRR